LPRRASSNNIIGARNIGGGGRFLIRTDHFILKFLLDQCLSTIPQHQWVSKLFGFDITVEYHPGHLHMVVDTLSRRDTDIIPATTTTASIYGPSFPVYTDLAQEVAPDLACTCLRAQLPKQAREPWREHDGLLLHGSRVFLPSTYMLLPQVIQSANNVHEVIQKTLQRLRVDFYLEHNHAIVHDYVRAYTACQQNKTKSLHTTSLLQLLGVPTQVWADITLDIIKGLPRVHGKSVIMTVVDRCSKYDHFIGLGHPYTASSVARAFFAEIIRLLMGFPTSIVSDHAPVFTGAVWRALFKLAGVKHRMSTTFHPQIDGQSEATNKTIAMYHCVAS
jgi:hypothetical protein